MGLVGGVGVDAVVVTAHEAELGGDDGGGGRQGLMWGYLGKCGIGFSFYLGKWQSCANSSLKLELLTL